MTGPSCGPPDLWEVGVEGRTSKRRSRTGSLEFRQRDYCLQNLERRTLLSGAALTVTLSSGVLTVTGTSAADQINISQDYTVWTITNGDWSTTKTGVVKKLVVNGGLGDDWIAVDAGITVPATLLGGAGNDVMTSGSGASSLNGNSGNDSLMGGEANDTLVGDIGNDELQGNGDVRCLHGRVHSPPQEAGRI